MTSKTRGNDLPDFLEDSRLALITSLKSEGILKSKIIEEALLRIPREEFLPEDTPKSLAYIDEPVALGTTGQTISAPHMIVIMLEELDLKPDLRVLEVGAGSGYNAALLSYVVSRGSSARSPLVVTVERNPDLVKLARKNLEQVGLSSVCQVVQGDGSLGYPQESKEELYDRIIVTAGAPRVPVFLKKQLKVGGIMAVPVGGSYQKLTILKKKSNDDFDQRRTVDCVFVPLIGTDAHSQG